MSNSGWLRPRIDSIGSRRVEAIPPYHVAVYSISTPVGDCKREPEQLNLLVPGSLRSLERRYFLRFCTLTTHLLDTISNPKVGELRAVFGFGISQLCPCTITTW